jgi:UDP-N-acetylglucosamine 2-epimerase
LVLFLEVERPEGVKAGFSKLVGCDPKKILGESMRSLKASKRFATAKPLWGWLGLAENTLCLGKALWKE